MYFADFPFAFGFTEKGVFDALDGMGLGCEKNEVKKWYDGFTFGSHTDIYNPWSIASFIKKMVNMKITGRIQVQMGL